MASALLEHGFVTTDVEALRRFLGTSVERRIQVADAIGANEQTLYQVLRGIPLKSGKPRGLGRKLRESLDAHFPGWRNPPGMVSEPTGTYRVSTHKPSASVLHADLCKVLAQLAHVSPGRWAMIRARIDAVVGHPDDVATAANDIAALLNPSTQVDSANRTGTAG